MTKLVGTPPLTKYSKTSPTVNRNFVIHIYQVNSNLPPPPKKKKKKFSLKSVSIFLTPGNIEMGERRR